jgi:DNA-binding MarR family transcriptional regulator
LLINKEFMKTNGIELVGPQSSLKQQVLEPLNCPVFLELQSTFPNASIGAIEMIFKFERVLSFLNIKRDSILTKAGLTPGRFHLLMILKREKNKCLSPSELAKRTSVSRGTMTQFIDAIEKDGFAVRVDDPNDKRGMLVRLTEKGETVLETVLPEYFNCMETMTKVLTVNDRENWLAILEKLVDGLSAHQA